MKDTPDASSSEDNGFAIVLTIPGLCVVHHHQGVPTDRVPPLVPADGVPPLRIMRIERKADRLAAAGQISMAHCPVCGEAVHEINRAVPIELEGLICSNCGSQKFRFAIRSLKPNQPKDATEWTFDLDVTCLSCRHRSFREQIINFFRLKRIRVTATGVDLQMFPPRKS